jgi:hypothetical protein
MRHVILHHHIFKNAGSTLDSALAAQFYPDFANLENDGKPVPEGMLIDFLDANPKVKAVSSHHIYGETFDPVLHHHGYRCFNLAMVRRPLDRLVSVYKYIRRTPSNIALWHEAKQLDIRSFVRLLIDKHPHEIDNPQVNTLANRGFYGRPVGEADLQRAWDLYQGYSLCAPVERFDEAMVAFEYFNSPIYFPNGLNMAYKKHNVSDGMPGEQNLREFLGPDNHDWLVELQKFDARLWQLTNDELSRRVALVPDFQERLAEFKVRCDSLQASN